MRTQFFNTIYCILLGFMVTSIPSDFIIIQAHAACDDDAGPSVDWKNCRKRNLIMDGFNFKGSNFTRADLSASDLRNSDLSNTTFIKTNLVRASLAGSLAENANFESVTASRTDFSKGVYRNSNFSKAEISRSNFSNSELEGSNMSKADFSRVNFFNANLKGVDLSFSNISRANLTGATIDENLSLKGAFLYLTRIEGLNLSSLQNLAQWQINMACGNDDTILPEGLTKPANWPCRFDETQ